MMKFGYWGISYKNADIDVRDKISFTDRKKEELLSKLYEDGISQCVILSTCNRSELYFMYSSDDESEFVGKCYRNTFEDVNIDGILKNRTGDEAIKYLFAVTTGLESMVLGEDQILGQVKEAYEYSKAFGYTGKEINMIFLDAISCAKKIKTEIKISSIPLSVSYIGIKHLNEACCINGRNVLVVGSGQTSALAIQYAYEYGADKIYVVNRTKSHMKELKKIYPNLICGDLDERYTYMDECSVIISATKAPFLVIKANEYNLSSEKWMLDLASPRDIDTKFSENKLCHLYDLDSIKEESMKNMQERQKLALECEEIIGCACQETSRKLLSTRVDDTIKSLNQRCQEIVDDSSAYLNRKLDLSPHEQKIVIRTLKASLRRLMKEPIEELKALDDADEQDNYKEIVAKLFQL
ncbi:MAG: glutamyl-tRNA reductase [Agathobacter sp.]|nr:glutamyl-tRNA reductase [Agathobacter sp.]